VHQTRDVVRGCPGDAGNDVPVQVTGDRGGRVTQVIAEDLDVDAGRQRETAVGVPEVVQTDRWETGVSHDAAELVMQVIEPHLTAQAGPMDSPPDPQIPARARQGTCTAAC
jgi:hypothetical protein